MEIPGWWVWQVVKESVFQYCRSLTIYILRIVIERGVGKATHEFVRNLGNELALDSRRDNFSVKGGENSLVVGEKFIDLVVER